MDNDHLTPYWSRLAPPGCPSGAGLVVKGQRRMLLEDGPATAYGRLGAAPGALREQGVFTASPSCRRAPGYLMTAHKAPRGSPTKGSDVTH